MRGCQILDLRPKKNKTVIQGWWRAQLTLFTRFLLPLSVLFCFISWCRKKSFDLGILKKYRAPVPIIVVGNIVVGGAGKTPVTMYLAQELQNRGFHPVVISRGYGRQSAEKIVEVQSSSLALEVGDEPLLIKQNTGCPVFVGANRPKVIESLLKKYPECDVIISDDGLQHFRMGRDVELVVLDRRLVGNGKLMPVGPLRESVSRLSSVDALIFNQVDSVENIQRFLPKTQFHMTMKVQSCYLLHNEKVTCSLDDLKYCDLHAVAGIGEPQRFFDYLCEQGLSITPHSFSDHHCYQARDFLFDAEVIITTQKDAVKIHSLNVFRDDLEIWVLKVWPTFLPDLMPFILEKLDES